MITENNILSSIPSLGSLFGTSASSDLINQINSSLPTQGVFGSSLDPFKAHYENFLTNIVNPILATHDQIQQLQVISITSEEDKIISIYNLDQLQFHCPSMMRLPILMYPPVMQLYEENKLTAWNLDIPKEVREHDIYGEAIKNCVADLDWNEEEGLIGYTYWESTYPDITLDELEDIQETRDFIDQILEETDFDPTDPSRTRDIKK
jgi:hypothetical protein